MKKWARICWIAIFGMGLYGCGKEKEGEVVDTIPPDTTITSYPANPTSSTIATFEFNCNEESCTFECKLNTDSWETCSSPKVYIGLSEGVHTFNVRAIDSAGNIDTNPAGYIWRIDATPPETTITSYPANPTSSTIAIFQFNCDEEPCSFECKLNTGSWEPCSSPQIYTGISEGSHIFYVRAIDSAWNVDLTPANYNWTVMDTTPPDTTITSHPPKVDNSTYAIFEFTCNEWNCTFECQLDDGGWVSCSSPKVYTGLSDGLHIFYVRAIDLAGNIDPSPGGYVWVIDTTPPDTIITSYPPNPSNFSTATFEFTCDEELCTFQCKLDADSWEGCSSPKTYTGLSEGSHAFYVRAIDSAGNIDSSPASYTWTIIDITPPDTTITSYPPNPSNSTSATFEFTCDEENCTFQCKLDAGSWEGCSSPKIYTGLSEGSHTFYVRAIDSAGNIDPEPASYTWAIDTTPPDTTITSNPPNPSNSTAATFRFICDEGSCSFECKLDSGAYALCSSPKTYSGLSEGAHTFYVRAIDSVGNVDPTPALYTWTIDTTPPDTIIISYPPNPSNSTTATFEFTCDEEPCSFQCRLDGGSWEGCSSPKTYTNLSEGNHTFYVRAIDSVGNVDPTPASYTWRIEISLGTWQLIAGSPSGRAWHTAVWTGSEMIVWGGYDGWSYTNTGGRYNPSTDSWIATSTTDAPSGRSGHTAVWTGTEMIVWGGYYYSGGEYYLNTGGRYNPSTDSWTPTSTTDAPSGRYEHTAVWTGSEMIVWGGYYRDGSNSYYLNTGGRYNPSTDSWTAISTTNAPSGRSGHTAVWTGAEMIVWGGYYFYYYNGGGYTYYLNTGGRYNPSTDSWTATSTTDAPSGRSWHTAVWTGTEMIVWGGYDGREYLNNGGRYRP